MEKRWLSIKETSIYLGLHSKTLYVWASKGILPCAKVGGVLRVDRTRVDELLERQISKKEAKKEFL